MTFNTPITTSQEIVSNIVGGTLDTELNILEKALAERRRVTRPASAVPLSVYDFRPGMVAYIKRGVRPHYLAGQKVIIERPKRERIDVRLEDQSNAGRFVGTFNIKPSCLSMVPV